MDYRTDDSVVIGAVCISASTFLESLCKMDCPATVSKLSEFIPQVHWAIGSSDLTYSPCIGHSWARCLSPFRFNWRISPDPSAFVASTKTVHMKIDSFFLCKNSYRSTNQFPWNDASSAKLSNFGHRCSCLVNGQKALAYVGAYTEMENMMDSLTCEALSIRSYRVRGDRGGD